MADSQTQMVRSLNRKGARLGTWRICVRSVYPTLGLGRWLWSALLLLLSLSTWAGSPDLEPDSPAPPVKEPSPSSPTSASPPEPLLWRVHAPDSEHVVYLFGSLHFGDDSFFPLPDKVLEAYRASEVLAVELDLTQTDTETLRATLARTGRYPSHVQIAERIGPELWEQLTQASQRLGLEKEFFVHVRPWLAALQLVNMQVIRSDYLAGQGVDRYFLDMAKGEKRIEPLETVDQQLRLFAGMDEVEQRAFLAHTLNDLEATGPQLRRMARAWREGRREDLEAVILGAFAADDPFTQELYRKIFKTRNDSMMEAVKGYLKTRQPVFFVVGIGHLIGPDGLVDGLRHGGYRVERL